MKLKVVFSGFLFCLFSFMPFIFVNGQENKDIRINEVLINSLDSNQKTIHGGWVELYNGGDSAVNIAGYFFTNDINNPTKYAIPDSGKEMLLVGHSYKVFYSLDTKLIDSSRLSFTLDDSTILQNGKGFIALFDTNGTTLISSVTYNIDGSEPGVSYGVDENGTSDTLSWITLTTPTPGSKNMAVVAKKEESGSGMLIALIVLGVVFALFFISRWSKKSKSKKDGSDSDDNKEVANNAIASVVSEPANEDEVIQDEIVAAIAMALHLYNQDSTGHETEQTGFRLDPNHVKNAPWANKMFTLRKLPIIK